MAYMQHLGVWDYSTPEDCFTATGRKPYGARWVYSDKSPNPEKPDLRSRLVVQEMRGNSSIAAGDVMSSFALRLLCFLCMSAPESDDFVIQVWETRSQSRKGTQLGFTPSSKPLSSPGASVPVDSETRQPLEEDLLRVSSDAARTTVHREGGFKGTFFADGETLETTQEGSTLYDACSGGSLDLAETANAEA
eukprot:1187513-Amphidinium_carterae.1